MNDHEFDRLARTLLTPAAPTPHERDATWEDVLRRLRPAPRAAIRAPRRLIAIVAAAAVAATTAVAVLPSGDRPGTAPPLLSTASAAEVLHAAAANATLGVPRRGEQLFVQERRVIPLGYGRTKTEILRSWAARDGSGRTEVTSSSTDHPKPVVTSTTYRGGGPAHGDAFADWRGTFTIAALRHLPTERHALLRALRAAVGRTARAEPDIGVLGRDLLVIGQTIYLLDRAPISAGQRAALFDLLASAPQWTVPGTSVTPLHVERVGPEASNGIRIRLTLNLTNAERRQIGSDQPDYAVDLTIDPEHARLTEAREYEDGLHAPPQVTTIEQQRIVPATH